MIIRKWPVYVCTPDSLLDEISPVNSLWSYEGEQLSTKSGSDTVKHYRLSALCVWQNIFVGFPAKSLVNERVDSLSVHSLDSSSRCTVVKVLVCEKTEKCLARNDENSHKQSICIFARMRVETTSYLVIHEHFRRNKNRFFRTSLWGRSKVLPIGSFVKKQRQIHARSWG